MTALPDAIPGYPLLWARPGRCGGRACVRGTRIWTATIAELWPHYRKIPRILQLWPELTGAQVAEALRFEGVIIGTDRCRCGHPRSEHECDVGACWDCGCGAFELPACEGVD